MIQGLDGCRFAVEHRCVAVIVDALRASATAAMLLDAGATELIFVKTVEDAYAAKAAYPDALLAGERGGLPPAGFDIGNSPRTVGMANGRRVIFTTTTGSQWLIESWGAAAVFMGTTVNASAVAQAAVDAAQAANTDIVWIPAGLSTDPAFSAQEDWVAATVIASIADVEVKEGRAEYDHWRARIEQEGVPALFHSAPHAAKLRAVNLADDLDYCSQVNLTDQVPVAVARTAEGIIVHKHEMKG